jgi:hypothetical protein
MARARIHERRLGERISIQLPAQVESRMESRLEQPLEQSVGDPTTIIHPPSSEGRVSEPVIHSSPWSWQPGERREVVGQRLKYHMGEWALIGGESLVKDGITPMWNRERDAREKLARKRKVVPFRGTARETEAYQHILQDELT